MSEETRIPPVLPKLFYLLLLIAGISLLVVWTAFYLVPKGVYYDVGLWSTSSILIFFGIVGYILYGKLDARAVAVSLLRHESLRDIL